MRTRPATVLSLLFVLLLATLAPPAGAQPNLELDLRIGPAVPLNDFSDGASVGTFISGSILAIMAPSLALGLEVGGNLGHDKSGSETTIFQLTPVARLQALLPNGGSVYLIGGFGYYRVDAEVTGGGPPEGTEHDFGVNIGLGFLIPLSAHASAGFDVRYHHLFESGSDRQYLVPGILVTYAP